MRSYKFARRSFLRGAGGLAPLMLPLLRSIEARAAGAAAPLRLLIIQHPLGTKPGLARVASRTPARRRPASRFPRRPRRSHPFRSTWSWSTV